MYVQCLQCLEHFEWSSYVYRNTSDEVVEQQLRNRPESAVARGFDRVRGIEWADERERAGLLARGLELHCPAGHWVPSDIRDNRTYVIGLIGPSGSSKSHYLAASVGQMLDDGLSSFGVTVHLHQWSEKHFLEKYYTPAWGEQRVLPRTMPADLTDDVNPPIALELQEVIGGRKSNVIFFDSAGEDLLNSAAQAKHSLYLSKASAMIFLVEPWSIPGLRSHAGVEQGIATFGGAAGIVRNTAVTLRTVRGFPPSHSFLDVPAAVVVAKSDQLDGHAGLPPEWMKDDNGRDAIARPDDVLAIRRRSAEIAPFLEEQSARNLLLTVQHAFPHNSFHMASATGGPPVDGRYDRLAPRRCLDPIVSLLVELGVLGTEDGQP